MGDKILCVYKSYFNHKELGPDRIFKFQNAIDIEVCPYCNISYINSYKYKEKNSEKDRRKNLLQLDHFFPQSHYQLFSMSLYNLIPSCPSCNMIKNDDLNDILYPYEEGFEDDVYFTYDISRNIILKTKDSIDSLKKQRIDNSIKLLHLVENYNCHKIYLNNLLNKKVLYSNGLIEKLIDFMKKNKIKGNVEDFIFGMSLNKSEDKFISMSKFTRDIISKDIKK